jgi:type III pantothenate kinase
LTARIFVVGQDIKVPIKNNYRYPRQVGQDRLVGAYAAKVFYGVPLIVVDFGTAITFDVVSKKGEYLGGIIVPGIRLTAESLFKKTALLPKVEIARPKELIGRDTKNSILSGIFYGYGSLCDGLVRLINQELQFRPKVIATGGYVEIMQQFSREIQKVDEELIFRGLSLLYPKA